MEVLPRIGKKNEPKPSHSEPQPKFLFKEIQKLLKTFEELLRGGLLECQFIEEEIPVHTQTIESYWSNVKRIMKRKGSIRQDSLQNHLNDVWFVQREKADLIGAISNLIHLSQIYAQNFFDGMAKKIYIKIKNKIN